MIFVSNGTDVSYCRSAVTRATDQRRETPSARHSPCASNIPLDDMVTTTTKPEDLSINPRGSRITSPRPSGTLGVPHSIDIQRASGNLNLQI